MRKSMPVGEKAPLRSGLIGQSIRAWFRLLLIEVKRSPAMFGAVVIALLTGYIMWDSMPDGVVRWREINKSAAEVAPVFASVIIGVFATHRAGVLRQRTLVDQFGTTTYPGNLHDLAGLLAVAAWGVAGYIVPVVGFYLQGARAATWGGPDFARPPVAMAAMVAAVAFGWLVGTVIRHRLAPLATVVLLLVLFFVDDFTQHRRTRTVEIGPDSWRTEPVEGWWHHLVPNNVLTSGYAGQIGLRTITWMLCLAGMFWLVGVVFRERTRSTALAVGLSALLTMGVGYRVVAYEPVHSAGSQIAFADLVCTTRLEDQVTACLHPENEALLDETADVVAPIVEPLVDVDGAPRLVIQGLEEAAYDHDGVFLYVNDLSTLRSGQSQLLLVGDLVRTKHQEPTGPRTTPAQYVVSDWLKSEAGIEGHVQGMDYPTGYLWLVESARREGLTLHEYGNRDGSRPPSEAEIAERQEAQAAFERDLEAAQARFAMLPDAERNAWLEANWEALVSGELFLEDLP